MLKLWEFSDIERPDENNTLTEMHLAHRGYFHIHKKDNWKNAFLAALFSVKG